MEMHGRWYVVSFRKHEFDGADPFGFMIETTKNVEGYLSYDAASTALEMLGDDKFPCAIISVEATFDRVAPTQLRKETKIIELDPWDVL